MRNDAKHVILATMALGVLALPARAHASARAGGEKSDKSEGPDAVEIADENGRPVKKDEAKKERVSDEPQPKRELVWSNVDVGFEGLYLRTFKADIDAVSLGILPANAVGPTVGVGLGLRFVFFTVGVRGRVAIFNGDAPGQRDDFQLWTLNAELGLRAPVGRFEPYVTLAGGYATFGGLTTAFEGLKKGFDVNGVNTRLAVGVDYYLTQNISLGAQVGGELLFITRYGTSVRDLATAREVNTLNQAKARVLEANGSNVGAAWSATGGVGVHF